MLEASSVFRQSHSPNAAARLRDQPFSTGNTLQIPVCIYACRAQVTSQKHVLVASWQHLCNLRLLCLGSFGHLQETVDSFKKTMPLIMDLRNSAMRPRHWANLMEVVGATFDPAGPGFTLDSVVKLHLDQHADLIADLSSNASKELAIETSIQAGLYI